MWRRGTLSRDYVADRWTPKCVRHLTGPPSIVFLQQMISVTRLRASLAAFILWRAGYLRTTKAVAFRAKQLNKKECKKRQSSLLAALCRGAKDAPPIQCGRGGIGRRAALRSLWGNSRGSSSLLDRTIQKKKRPGNGALFCFWWHDQFAVSGLFTDIARKTLASPWP